MTRTERSRSFEVANIINRLVEGRWAPPLVQRGHDDGVVIVLRCGELHPRTRRRCRDRRELYPRTRRRCRDRPSLRRTVSAHLCTSFQGIPEGSSKPDDSGNAAERFGQTCSTPAPPTSAYGHGVVSSARTFRHLCRTSSRTTKSSEEIGDIRRWREPLLAAIRHRETLKIIRPTVDANSELLLPSKMGGPAAEADLSGRKRWLYPVPFAAASRIGPRAVVGSFRERQRPRMRQATPKRASDERTNRAQGLPVRGTNHGFVLRRLQGPDRPDGRRSVWPDS
jgi:hypothetical protein